MICPNLKRIENFESPSNQKGCTSLCHHHLHKLLVIDLAITIDVGFPNHFIDLLVCELLAQICHDMTQLGGTDEAISIAIEHLEGLDEFFFRVRILHFACHERQEFGEIDCAISISIDLVDHVLQFCLGWVLTQGSHDSSQLFCGDGAITVLVKERECLLELGNLLLSKLIGHGFKTGEVTAATLNETLE